MGLVHWALKVFAEGGVAKIRNVPFMASAIDINEVETHMP